MFVKYILKINIAFAIFAWYYVREVLHVTIYDRIDLKLKELGSNRKRMCEEIGLSYNTLMSSYLRKSDRMPLDVAKKIADYISVSLDWLITGQEHIPPSDEVPASSYDTPPTAEEIADMMKALRQINALVLGKGVDWDRIDIAAMLVDNYDEINAVVRKRSSDDGEV